MYNDAKMYESQSIKHSKVKSLNKFESKTVECIKPVALRKPFVWLTKTFRRLIRKHNRL